ncbi:predicted protein [Postia placenta Mad-698-R]|nr:predicted protein [Postia placenta Mad-698-R]
MDDVLESRQRYLAMSWTTTLKDECLNNPASLGQHTARRSSISPSLLLAEQIEQGLIHFSGQSIVELGAGAALPSLLSSTLSPPPSLVVITDYPDATILGNLEKNVERNERAISDGCRVHYRRYEWGQDVAPLLALLPAGHDGFDTVICPTCCTLTGRMTPSSPLSPASSAAPPEPAPVGLVWEERLPDGAVKGALPVAGGGLNTKQLDVRKSMCRSQYRLAGYNDTESIAFLHTVGGGRLSGEIVRVFAAGLHFAFASLIELPEGTLRGDRNSFAPGGGGGKIYHSGPSQGPPPQNSRQSKSPAPLAQTVSANTVVHGF